MTHHTVREWGTVKFADGGLTRAEADTLHAAACNHPLAHRDATNILVYRRDGIAARQMVGMVAAGGCSLEILPKVDPDATDDENVGAVRNRLIRMLDVALGLDLDAGGNAAIARQHTTLLEILIRSFVDKLSAEVRRGLPRRYRQCEADLPALRGRLDLTRQFTRNAVRPDRLACRFDQLDVDTSLMRVMAAATVFLSRYARSPETRRRLDELRHILAEVPLVPVPQLPWTEVRIDRTNRRWESLFSLARLLIQRDWQAMHRSAKAPEGLTLLFPMNDLFEKYVAALLRKAMAGQDVEVVDQGGHRACLGNFTGSHLPTGEVFRTRPDIILRRGGRILTIIDTKWKKLALNPLDRKHGVSQSDVYQLMAYARLYPTDRLMLLYPELPGRRGGHRKTWGMAGGCERLQIATIDVSHREDEVTAGLTDLVAGVLSEYPFPIAPSEVPTPPSTPGALTST